MLDLLACALHSSSVDKHTAFDRFLHDGKIVAGFGMLGSVLAGISLVWIPAFGSVDVHLLGGAVGAGVGLLLNVRHIV